MARVHNNNNNDSICPFLLLRTVGKTEEEDIATNLTNLRKAIGAAITKPTEAGIVRDIMNWINFKDEVTRSFFNGFVKTSKYLGASSLLTAIKNQCKENGIPVAYIACGLFENKNEIIGDKFYCRLKDLLTKDKLNEEDLLKFFTAAFNLSNVLDSLGEMCRNLKGIAKDLGDENDIKRIIDFFRKHLNIIRNEYCNKFLSESSDASANYFNFGNGYRITYNEAYDVFTAYNRELLHNKTSSIKKSEEVQYTDKYVENIESECSSNIVILIDDFELAVKEMIGEDLVEGKRVFDNAKKFIDIITSINSNDSGIKFIVPVRSCIYDIGNSKLEKKPLYLSVGWEKLFKNEKLENILISLIDSSMSYKCSDTQCEFKWDGLVNDKIFSRGKIGKLVELCDKNPYYLFRSLFLAHNGMATDSLCTVDADERIKRYFVSQFKDDIFELLSLYLLESIDDEKFLKNLTLSKVVGAAICWVGEFVAHKYECTKDGSFEYRICTIYAREKVSQRNKEYGELLGDKRIRKAIIDALQDVGVIMIRKNDNPPSGCPDSCYRSSSKLYARYYNDSKYRSFKAFFIKNYKPSNDKEINIKEYRLHPFINYIFSDDTIFAIGKVA